MSTNVFLYAYGNAAENNGCKDGPLVIKKALETQQNDFCWHAPLFVSNHHQKKSAINDVATLCTTLSYDVKKSVLMHQHFITLGGDHTAAIGSWNGAMEAINSDLGLIWVDAHLDSHTFETTPSNNIHGMPLAILLGYGDSTLTSLSSKKLKPGNTVIIGARSFECGEHDLLKKLGVKIFYMTDIKKCGLKKVFEESIAIVTKNTEAFGISIDLDGFNPNDAPGVGSREKDGIPSVDFLAHFWMITQNNKYIGMDIVEFNPSLDHDNKTLTLAMNLIDKSVLR